MKIKQIYYPQPSSIQSTGGAITSNSKEVPWSLLALIIGGISLVVLFVWALLRVESCEEPKKVDVK